MRIRKLPVLLILVVVSISLLATYNLASQISRTHTIKQQQELQRQGSEDMLRRLSARVCGSPAAEGYAHVNPECLEASPTNTWWHEWQSSGASKEHAQAVLEQHADYDGLAVVWGIGHTTQTAEDCAEACRSYSPTLQQGGPFSRLPCNVFAWCSEQTCFEPDVHTHSFGDCWLKFSEGPLNPEVNMRGVLSDDYRIRHPNAPKMVQWHSGVVLPIGLKPSNGTYSPRFSW
ncbi:TPA: hypothetical protein ACH3X2_008559 [Trebouxia sp. C0005]